MAHRPGPMTPYDEAAWRELQQWKHAKLDRPDRALLPVALRNRLDRAGGGVKRRFDALPGAARFETMLLDALRGLTDLGSKAARASVRRGAIVKAYRKRGFEVASLADVRSLTLADIDRVKPRLDLAYVAASTVEGAGAGLAVSGGALLATGGTVASAGAGAAPGAATVVGAMAADAAFVIGASQRAVAHIAAYYGYDVDDPQERLFALGVLGVGVAVDGTKAAAYWQLNQLVQQLARRATWEQLSRNGVAQVVRRVYGLLGMQLTQRKLGQAVPVAGVLIGAGMNARLLSRVVDDAEHLYRERFLREYYGLDVPTGPASGSNTGPAPVPISDIVEAEVIAETRADDRPNSDG